MSVAARTPANLPYRARIAPVGNPDFQEVVTRPLYSDEECDAVLAALRSEGWEEAAITDARGEGSGYDVDVRSARLQKLPETSDWPRAELLRALAKVNAEVFRFALVGVYASDAPAVVRYEATRSDHFRPHQDAGRQHPRRKLTYSVQLTDGDRYLGGDLLFRDGGVLVPRARGTLVVFPSTLHHVVSPVTRGTRDVLVGWVHGPSLV